MKTDEDLRQPLIKDQRHKSQLNVNTNGILKKSIASIQLI
jgi:hypothetical protein